MSISQDSAATIVCKEVFDEASHPSNEEVLQYAKRLGIDPDTEPHLLDLAREGLMAALPKGWVPCLHEASGSWYYYESASKTTTWEHPLDAVYREIVEQTRAGKARQTSVEEDSRATTKDLESHEEATLPKDASASKDGTKSVRNSPSMTKIPTKLAPLKKPEKPEGARRKEPSAQGLSFKREDSKSENSLAANRTARDYTNLRFQDPRFYECPKLLESQTSQAAEPAPTTAAFKSELDLNEVLKRSESLSPRNEKDWEQLSSKFSSEENIIDIDKLSITALARSDKSDKFDKEKHPSQFGQQRELTLNGGGTMFLKSSRSRDTTPSHEGGKLDEFKAVTVPDEVCNVVGDKLKSILREKPSEDADDRPADEERKSVRFDIEKEIDAKFTYSGSEGDWESESEEQNVPPRNTGWHLSSPNADRRVATDKAKDSPDRKLEEAGKRGPLSRKPEPLQKNAKVVGNRFVVQNVSENEHRSRIVSEKESQEESLDRAVPSKFSQIKSIDTVARTATDRDESDARRKNGSLVNFDRDEQTDDEASESSAGNRNRAHEPFRRRSVDGVAKHPDYAWARPGPGHRAGVDALKKDFEDQLEKTRKELEENFLRQKEELEKNSSARLAELRRDMIEKEEREIQKLIAEMDEARLENLKKVKAELEVCYEKERKDILANLKTELDERRRELLELRNQEIGKLENEHERDLGEERSAKLGELELTKQHGERIEAMKKELEKELDELRGQLRAQQREKIAKMTESHEKRLAEIQRDFKINEDLSRKMFKQRLEEIRSDLTRDAEKEAKKQAERSIHQESIEFEKMRCEKRLLQDKYTALKEKYVKLKQEVRSAVERRSRRREGYATASETERSTSTRTKTDRTESSEQNTPLRNTRSSSTSTNAKVPETQTATSVQSEATLGTDEANVRMENSGLRETPSPATAIEKNAPRFDTDDTTTASETNANTTKKKRIFAKRAGSSAAAQSADSLAAANNNTSASNNNNNVENPVESIRKQLEKLEDLGDRLPSNETAYTLRYPFQDKATANASSELAFFRHRIHVERDSVKRAREALRYQKNVFQGRQRAWKQRSATATLAQLDQEERELSDMEINLHRTKSLLGEKVIHLRHLEQSLERVANAKRNENDSASTRNDEFTLSDMSSASSGFSSTDFGTDTLPIDKPDHYQESTEIIASLENLNSEIREIWGVLNKRQDTDIPPPPPPPPTLMYSYLRWLRFHHLTAQSTAAQGAFGTPNIQSNILSQLTATQPLSATTTHNIVAQYGPNSGFTTSVGTVEKTTSNLMERTWNLRDWLRQARIEHTDFIGPGQATL